MPYEQNPFEYSNEESDQSRKEVKEGETSQKTLSFEDVVSPDHLRMISQASGGFRFEPDRTLAEETLQTGWMKIGYTDKRTRTIHYNPLILQGLPEHGIKPWRPQEVLGFAYHEAGHHAPEVLQFDNELIEELKNPEVVPGAYRGSPQSETRFLKALYTNLCNALVDMWLESFMGRRPYFSVRDAIEATGKGMSGGEVKGFQDFSKPQQLMQALLRSRFAEDPDLGAKVDPDVYEAYQRIGASGAMEATHNRRAFENYFAAETDKERAIARKLTAYKKVFLPEYLALLQNEIQERSKDRQKQKSAAQDEEEGQQEGGAKPRRSPDEAVPLTYEEEQELLEEFLRELEKAAKESHCREAPSKEEEQERQKKFREIEGAILARHKDGGKEEKPEEAKQPQPKGLEAIAESGEEMRRKQREESERGLAQALRVREESVRRWEEIKERYRLEIESTAAALAEIFLDDRRKRLEFLKREGAIVPGLEYETVAALLSGEIDPDTKMKEVRNPEFLETECEFIVDTSGSMGMGGGEKIARSVELLVIIVEAFKRVKEDLEAENLLTESEEPFRVGVTKFADAPERVTTLDEPLDDKKEITIIDKASRVGGGTEETGALKEVYGALALRSSHIIKIIAVLTDGEGNQEGVAPIMRQIEEDDEVIFLAVGLAGTKEEAQAIVDTYLEPLQDREKNVFGIAADNPNEVLPQVLEFLKREVEKRRKF